MSQTKAQLISDLVQALNFTGTSSAPANGMYLSAANTIKLATNSNGRLTIDSSGNAVFTGTCTATTFIGALTGTASGNAVLTGSTNNQIVTVTGANAIQGETKLTFTGALLDFAINNGAQGFRIGATGDHYPIFEFDANRSGASSNCGQLDFKWDGTGIARIATLTGSDTTNKDNGSLAFMTSTAGTLAEALRIDPDGNVKIGDATTDYTYKLTVSGNGTVNTGIFMHDGGAGTWFGIQTQAANGLIVLRADARSGAYPPLTFNLGGSEKIRIDTSGRLLIGHTATRAIAGGNALLQIEENSSELATFLRTDNGNGAAWLALAKSRSSAGAACQAGDNIGAIAFVPHDGTDLNHHAAEIRAYVDTGIGTDDTPGYLTFHTNPGGTTTGERLRINAFGNLMTGGLSEPLGYGYHGANSTTFTIYDANANGGVLEVGGNPYLNSYNAGSIGFMNNNNSDASTPWSAGSKFVHLIRAQIYTSDNNAGDDSGADLLFYRKNEAAACTEGMRIKHNGDVSLADGNLVIAQAGKGIDFSAQVQSTTGSVASGDEVLDHYEHGTFTPNVLVNYSTTNVTQPGTRNGTYTRIGSRVFFGLHITGSFSYTGSNLNVTIGNLPFTANGNSSHLSSLHLWAYAGISEGDHLIARIKTGNPIAYIQRTNPGASVLVNQCNTTNWNFMMGGSYTV